MSFFSLLAYFHEKLRTACGVQTVRLESGNYYSQAQFVSQSYHKVTTVSRGEAEVGRWNFSRAASFSLLADSAQMPYSAHYTIVFNLCLCYWKINLEVNEKINMAGKLVLPI